MKRTYTFDQEEVLKALLSHYDLDDDIVEVTKVTVKSSPVLGEGPFLEEIRVEMVS